MLQLFANGSQLDTAGVKFNLTLKNPMFQNTLDSAYAYDLQFPETDNNKKQLVNFAHRLAGNNEPGSPVIKGLFNGLKLLEGNFIFSGGKGSLKGSMGLGQGNFLHNAKKYLDEVDYGKKTFANEAAALAYFNSIISESYPNTDFVLPHTTADADVFLPSGTTGYWNKDTMNFWDVGGTSYTITNSGDRAIIVPHLYLQFVLKQMFNKNGYQFNDQFFALDPDWSKLIVWNSFNANGGIPDEGDKPGYSSLITDIIYGRHVPHVKISDFISGLQNLLNVRFFFNHSINKVEAKDTIDVLANPEYIDITNKVVKGHELKFRKKDGFQLHSVPDGNDELYKVFVDQGEEWIKKYGGVVESLSDLPEYWMGYDHYYVLSESKFYKWNVTLGWYAETSSHVIHKEFIPNSEYNIESSISTLYQANDTFSKHGNAAIDYRDNTARISFYNGMQNYLGSDYPSSQYKRNGKYLNYYTDWLYLNRWEKYLSWLLDPKIIVVKAALTAKDIKDFDFSIKRRIDGINYFVEEIKTPISEHEIGLSTLKCWKV